MSIQSTQLEPSASRKKQYDEIYATLVNTPSQKNLSDTLANAPSQKLPNQPSFNTMSSLHSKERASVKNLFNSQEAPPSMPSQNGLSTTSSLASATSEKTVYGLATPHHPVAKSRLPTEQPRVVQPFIPHAPLKRKTSQSSVNPLKTSSSQIFNSGISDSHHNPSLPTSFSVAVISNKEEKREYGSVFYDWLREANGQTESSLETSFTFSPGFLCITLNSTEKSFPHPIIRKIESTNFDRKVEIQDCPAQPTEAKGIYIHPKMISVPQNSLTEFCQKILEQQVTAEFVSWAQEEFRKVTPNPIGLECRLGSPIVDVQTTLNNWFGDTTLHFFLKDGWKIVCSNPTLLKRLSQEGNLARYKQPDYNNTYFIPFGHFTNFLQIAFPEKVKYIPFLLEGMLATAQEKKEDIEKTSKEYAEAISACKLALNKIKIEQKIVTSKS